MTKRLALLLVCVFVCALCAQSAAAAPIPGQYIVVLKDGVDVSSAAADHRRNANAQVLDTYGHALHAYAAKLSSAGLAKVKADKRVAFVTQDQEGNLLQAAAKPPPPPPGQTLPTGINRIDADASSAQSGNKMDSVDVDIAIYDTGIQTNHPDLNVVGGVNCLGAIRSGNDGTIGDQYGHGTHTAGIAAARDNTVGSVGVAPGARLWSVRVADSAGATSTSSQLCGIDWLAANASTLGIKAVNASMGLWGKADDGNCGNTVGDPLHQAICNSVAAGVLWVFAAGNTAGDVNYMPGAGYDEVLAVTSMGDINGQANPMSTTTSSCSSVTGAKTGSYTDDKYVSYSRYAVSAADKAHTVAAPGMCIYSTYKGSSYGLMSGTSMAAPHATGLAALCAAALQCTGTPAETIQKLVGDAAAHTTANPSYGYKGDPVRPQGGGYYGYLIRAGLY
jgi:subtilisin family serine protease